jgi:L-alanine-DL-glutamate epimerase-like enolase superfamily enzyme
MPRRDVPVIDRVDVSAFRVPLDEPESDGTFTWTETALVVVEPVAAGCRGLGFTYAPPACGALIHDVLLPAVVGADARSVPATWREMVGAIRNLGRPGLASSAIAAVDVALWDLKAKLLGIPLCDLLGRCHDRVAVYGSGGFTSLTEHELVGQLASWVHDDGIPRVKMKVGTAWGSAERRDAERAAAARQAIGDDAELYVDANGGYARKQAVRMAKTFELLGVTWFEEPVSSDDLGGLHEIREAVDADVAAGEYGYDLAYFERMCAAGAVDVLQADVSRCAGITEWRRAAAVAAAHGLEISGHCAPFLHLHVACSVPNIRHLEYFADHVRATSILFDGVPAPVDGSLAPDPDAPGLGLTLKGADADRYRVPIS